MAEKSGIEIGDGGIEAGGDVNIAGNDLQTIENEKEGGSGKYTAIIVALIGLAGTVLGYFILN